MPDWSLKTRICKRFRWSRLRWWWLREVICTDAHGQTFDRRSEWIEPVFDPTR